MPAPDLIRVTDETIAAELVEAITNLCHAAKREYPRTNTTGVLTGWDKRHASINELLGELEAKPASAGSASA